MEMLRRFLLVGVFVVVRQGTVEQLAYGALVAILYLVIQLQAAPYRNEADQHMAAACSLCLVVLFVCCIFYKYGALTQLDDLQERMSVEQRSDYVVPYVSLSAVLLLSCAGAIIALGVIIVVQVAQEAERVRQETQAKSTRRLRRQADGKEVELSAIEPAEGGRSYHLFLSHTWAQGQSEMRIVKDRLRELLPTVRVFLGAHIGTRPPAVLCAASRFPPCLRSDLVRCVGTPIRC